MQVIEYMNAVSMIPGVVMALQVLSTMERATRIWYCPFAYIIMCFTSMLYHSTKVHYGYHPMIHKLDIIAQQLCVLAFSLANPYHQFLDTYIILGSFILSHTFNINKYWERHLLYLVNFVSSIFCVVPNGRAVTWEILFCLKFIFFVLSYYRQLAFLHVLFHATIHLGALYFWFLIM